MLSPSHVIRLIFMSCPITLFSFNDLQWLTTLFESEGPENESHTFCKDNVFCNVFCHSCRKKQTSLFFTISEFCYFTHVILSAPKHSHLWLHITCAQGSMKAGPYNIPNTQHSFKTIIHFHSVEMVPFAVETM